MLIVSTGFKNAILGPKSFAEIFNGGSIRLFSGARPAKADLAEPVVPVGSIKRIGIGGVGLKFVLSGTYVIKPVNDLWQFLADQPGSVHWWRLVGPGDDAGDSLTLPRIDGDIGTSAAPADLTLTQTLFDAGATLQIDSFLYTLPPVGN
jgi:hypothetical protein